MALTVTSKLTNSTLNPQLVKILQDLENKIPESSGSNVEIVSTSLKKAYLDCDVDENLQFDFVKRIYADFNYFVVGIFVYTIKPISTQKISSGIVLIHKVIGSQAPTFSIVFSPFSNSNSNTSHKYIRQCTYYYSGGNNEKTKIEFEFELVGSGISATVYIPYIGIK